MQLLSLGEFKTSSLMRFITLQVGLLFALNLVFLPKLACANLGLDYGWTPGVASLSGTSVAWGFGTASVFHNPAALVFDSNIVSQAGPKQRLLLELGLVAIQPSFIAIKNVVVDNNYLSASNSSPKFGNFSVNPEPTFGQVLGLRYALFPEWHNVTLGFLSFLPLLSLANIDTGTSFAPEYVLYSNRTSKPQFDVALGFRASPSLSFGLGVHTGFVLNSASEIRMNTAKTKNSSVRLSGVLSPKLAPYFGVLFQSVEELEAGLKGPFLTAGLVFRAPLSHSTHLDVRTEASALVPLNVEFYADSVLFYDPLSLELGTSFAPLTWLRLFAQMDLQFWSSFTSSNLTLTPAPQAQSIALQSGTIPPQATQDLVLPRLGLEFFLSDWHKLRAGLAYRASIFKELPIGAGNLIDTNHFMSSLGWIWKIQNFLGSGSLVELSTYVSARFLLQKMVQKTAGNEQGDLSDEKIGSPSYVIGGSVFGGGVSLTFAF